MPPSHPEHACVLLAAMLAHHCWGRPVSREAVVSFAAVSSDELGRAGDDFETLRTDPTYPFVGNRGPRRAVLETGEFDTLAQFLYDACGWERWKIESRLKHFETEGFAFE